MLFEQHSSCISQTSDKITGMFTPSAPSALHNYPSTGYNSQFRRTTNAERDVIPVFSSFNGERFFVRGLPKPCQYPLHRSLDRNKVINSVDIPTRRHLSGQTVGRQLFLNAFPQLPIPQKDLTPRPLSINTPRLGA